MEGGLDEDKMGLWRERIHHNLLRLMKKHNISQAELARLLDVDASNVSRWMKGKACPDIIVLDRMTEQLGWLPNQLTSEFSGETKPKLPKLGIINAMETIGEAVDLELKIRTKKPDRTKK